MMLRRSSKNKIAVSHSFSLKTSSFSEGLNLQLQLENGDPDVGNLLASSPSILQIVGSSLFKKIGNPNLWLAKCACLPALVLLPRRVPFLLLSKCRARRYGA